MKTIRALGAGFALFLCLFQAAPMAAASDFMTLGEATTSPIGHHLFCQTSAGECRPGPLAGAGAAVELDPPMILSIARINTETNLRIVPISDRLLYGVEEKWTYPQGRGDCEDFVLAKRKALHAAGIALSNLLITVVRKTNGEGHAVLTVRTTSGDFILDNLDWRVRPWRETPYTYVKRQDASDPGRWIAITPVPDVVVGAVGR